MKKRNTFLYLILAAFLALCSCRKNCLKYDQAGEDAVYSILSEPFEQADLSSDANIIFWDSQNLVYAQEDRINTSVKDSNWLYHLDVRTGESKQLAELHFFNASGDIGTIYEDDLYIVGSLDGERFALYKIDIETAAYQEIKELDSHTSYVDISPAQKQVVLLSVIRSEDGTLTYQLDSVDLSDCSSQTVVQEIYKNGEGTCIPCFDADADYIYAYEIVCTKNNLSYQMSTYDFSGNKTANDSLDLSGFIETENNNSNDSVLTM